MKVTFKRPDSWIGMYSSYEIFVNGEPKLSLENGKSETLELSDNENRIVAKIWGGGSNKITLTPEYANSEVEVKPHRLSKFAPFISLPIIFTSSIFSFTGSKFGAIIYAAVFMFFIFLTFFYARNKWIVMKAIDSNMPNTQPTSNPTPIPL